MDEDYAGSTIRQIFIAMRTLFKSALMIDLIAKQYAMILQTALRTDEMFAFTWDVIAGRNGR